MTDRASFLAQLYTGPLLKADAIIVLCGEDGQARADTGMQLFRQRGAPALVLSGGRDEPPAILGAASLGPSLLGEGVAPGSLIIEAGSLNTHEQAVNVLSLARENEWKQLLLVASAYHLPRALLTFITEADEIQIIPMPAKGRWSEIPPGLDRTRAELFHVESVKITEYQQLGYCASYQAGLEYLKQWEAQ